MDEVAQRRCTIATLYATHASRLRSVLRYKLSYADRPLGPAGPLRAHEIDDLIQDVFARLLVSDARIAEGRDPIPYLVMIARNLRTDIIRRDSRLKQSGCLELTLPVALQQELVGELLDETDLTPHHSLRLQTLSEYLRRLPEELWKTYDARYVRGLSQRDAALWLGVSRRQVRMREERVLSGGRRQIRVQERQHERCLHGWGAGVDRAPVLGQRSGWQLRGADRHERATPRKKPLEQEP